MPEMSTPSTGGALRGDVVFVAACVEGSPGIVNGKVLHHKLPKSVNQLADDYVIFGQKAVVW